VKVFQWGLLCRKRTLEQVKWNDDDLAALNTIPNLGSAIREGITMPKRNLPVFDGDPLQYFGFMKRFEEIVLKQTSEPALQWEYLKR